MTERIKVLLWRLLHYPLFKCKCYFSRKQRRALDILTSEQTVDNIITMKCSVARFGDGELQMISHYLQKGTAQGFKVDTFQSYNTELGKRLFNILSQQHENLMVCLPYQLKDSTICDFGAQIFWDREWLLRKDFIYPLSNQLFGDTSFTRFYLSRKDIKSPLDYIQKLQRIWTGREILIVEGKFSRLGVGNDLFSSASSIKRLICPATNAFSKYDDILHAVNINATESTLILLALGHTATVLAFDLYRAGLQAIDIGHIDIEYEWFLMGATEKVAIPNKYVNEVQEGRIQQITQQDTDYLAQIVQRIE